MFIWMTWLPLPSTMRYLLIAKRKKESHFNSPHHLHHLRWWWTKTAVWCAWWNKNVTRSGSSWGLNTSGCAWHPESIQRRSSPVSVQHRSQICKVMFLGAKARPRYLKNLRVIWQREYQAQVYLYAGGELYSWRHVFAWKNTINANRMIVHHILRQYGQNVDPSSCIRWSELWREDPA